MNKEKIGTNAGRIWRYLESSPNGACSFQQVQDSLELSDWDFALSLGWLARENKIVIDEAKSHVMVPLCPFF
jgi:hypothetical protein